MFFRQRYIYPIDPKRINEFGTSQELEEERKKKNNEEPNGNPPEVKPLEEKKNE